MARKLQFLLLEDQATDAELIIRELREAGLQFVAICVATEADFLARLREDPPDVILADYSLPNYDGLSALTAVQEERPEIPFIFVSGNLGEEAAIEALQRGATDCVLKQRLSRLGPAVKRALREVEDHRQRAQAEQHIRELNLLLRAIRDISQLIVRERDPGRLLAEACKILVQTRGYLLAWVGLAEPGSRRVVPAAKAGDHAAVLDTVQVTWDDTPTGQGPTGTAMRTGQPWTCQDTATDPRFAPWREAALERGYASAAAVPMRCGERTVGVVTVYSGRKHAFHEEELGLLKQLADDLARALQTIEYEKQRKSAEEALKNSEHRSRALFEYAPDAYYLYDLQGRFVDGNKAAELLSGYHRAELIGKSFLQLNLLPPEGLARAATRLAQNAQGEATGPDEFTFQRKDGSEVSVEIRTYPVCFEDEVLVLGIARDLTHRKKAERALAESQAFRKAILDHIPDPVWLKDLQGHFLACNEGVAQVYGKRVQDILGKTVFETIPSKAEELNRQDQDVIASGQPIRVEQLFTDAWGQKRWFDTIKSPIFNERGEVTGTMGVSRDTTKRRHSDEALRNSEERFRSVWEHSFDGMRLTDSEGRILDVNEAFCRLVKMPREKLIGQVFFVAYEGQSPVDDIQMYRQRFEAGTVPHRLMARLRLWNSEELDVEVSSSFVDSGFRGRVLLSLFRDVGERNRAEARVAAFSQLGLQLSAAASALEAGEIIVAVADQLLGWDACSFGLYSATEKTMHHVLNRDLVDGRRAPGIPGYNHSPPSPLAQRVIESGGQLILKEKADQLVPGGVAFGNKTRPSASILLVPARAGTEVVGLLSIHSYTAKAYDEHDLETLQMLADHCGGALKRISAQEALTASEANYRALVERSPDAVFLHRDGKFVYTNPAAVKLLGAERPEQVLGRSIYDIVPPENRKFVEQRVGQETGGESTPLVEQRIMRLDGISFEAEVTGIPFSYEGRPAVQTIMREITARKNSERRVAVFSKLGQKLSAAKTAREAAETIVEVADQLLGWDSCNFALYSPAEKLLHHVLSRDVIDGRRAETSPVRNHEPPTPLAMRVIEEGGQLILKEDPARMLPDGVPIGDTSRPSASLLYVPIRNDREMIGLFSIQSYTPRAYDQHSLETLQALADHCGAALNRITTEEALNSAQQQLRQAQKMEAIGQLAGGVAHDFNNLLAVIRGNAELLLMDAHEHTETTNDCLKQVTAASERAANLTRQLLAFSRKQVMQSQPLVLNQVVEDVSKMLKRIIGEHINLEYRYADPLPFVRADASMIEQVLLNLAVNARDAMPRGGRLLIATSAVSFDAAYAANHPDADAGEFVCVTVSDTGTGIAPEHLPRIFEPFFTTKELGKGTGLGLATAYGIVQQHQGWIEVSSQPGAGATFKLFLPVIPPPAAASAVLQAGTEIPGGTESILLVEDEYAVRVITRRVLESQGYKVYEATTAREALEVWRSRVKEIALLLTDVVMPEGITGRDLTEQLRAQQPILKVIFMSGYSADVIGQDSEFFQRTRSYFLQKPFSAQALLQTVRHCLDEKHP